MGKQIIRKQFLDCRKRLDCETRSRLSLLAQRRLIATEMFDQAQSLALYSPVNNEVETAYIDRLARDQRKRVYYPRVVGEELEFVATASIDQLVPGAFGVAEPVGEKGHFAGTFDLIVVPGVAFDLCGHRLGYGRGYYDRQLAGKASKILTIGLCFEVQLCERLPIEAHDQPLDYVLTESRLISCHI